MNAAFIKHIGSGALKTIGGSYGSVSGGLATAPAVVGLSIGGWVDNIASRRLTSVIGGQNLVEGDDYGWGGRELSYSLAIKGS